jgi:hypothetical protein
MIIKKFTEHEFMFNPLVGLAPLLAVSICEIYLGLMLSLYVGVFISILVLLQNYFSKAISYQAIILVNLFFLLFLLFIKNTTGLLSSSFYESLAVQVCVVVCLIVSFLLKPLLFKFFYKQYTGYGKHMECNLREFYFISKFLLIISIIPILLFLLSFIVPSFQNIYALPAVNQLKVIFIFILMAYELFRVNRVCNLLKEEEFWPIVNNSGLVIGKIAASVSLAPSKFKELHPVVRVHFIDKGSVYLFHGNDKSTGADNWDCLINEHVWYGETMEQAIVREADTRYGLKNIKPHFLLKHIVEESFEKQYILLYYISGIENIQLQNSSEGQVKSWPMWQIDENLQKGVFSKAFEVEYDYIKNTVLLAERFLHDEALVNN